MYPEFHSRKAAERRLAMAKRPFTYTLKKWPWTEGTKCVKCNKSIFDFSDSAAHPKHMQSHRCVYDPLAKKSAAMHYSCAWKRPKKPVAVKEEIAVEKDNSDDFAIRWAHRLLLSE